MSKSIDEAISSSHVAIHEKTQLQMSFFFVFFLLSGFCSLVYQVVWLRVAMAGFGVTTMMISIVLSIFMAGLALGSWAGGGLVRFFELRSAKFFILLYGATELVIGISGLVVAPLLRTGRTLLLDQGASWGSPGYYFASAAWVALVMLPFCTCMGATFPLAMAGIRTAFRAKASTSFSYLYLANVLGAMAGAIGSAFLSIELLGFSKTLWIAAMLNGVIAVTASVLAFGRRESLRRADGAAVPTGGQIASGREVSDAAPASRIALPLLFTSGLASLGMEVVWTRQFIPILGPVVYSFAAILAVYLAATAVGSRAYRIWIKRSKGVKREQIAVTVTAILAGVCAFLPLLATDPRIRVHGYTTRGLLIVCGIGPFCAVAGFMTPMLVDWWSRGNPNRAGKAYAVNAAGCILGPLLAGFVLLPIAGERWILLVLALPFFGFGVWAMGAGSDVREGWSRPSLWRLLAAASAASILILVFTRDFESLFPNASVRRDYTATSIAAGKGMDRVLLINGVGITRLSPVTKMMVHLPMASLSGAPHSALVLCFGMGTSFRSALSWGVPVTVAELVPSVPSLFSYFHGDGNDLLRSPKAKVVIDDARRFLERTRESFDVIVIDPPPPVEAAGSSLLYSTEFYQVVRSHLRPGGILQQWLPEGDATVRSAFAQSLQHTFRYVRVFDSTEGWGYHFLASDSAISSIPAATLAARLPPAAAQDLIEWGPSSNASSQFQTILDREKKIQDLVQGAPSAPLLTDDRPVNEYYLLRRMYGERAPVNAAGQSNLATPPIQETSSIVGR
jgi:spermidine synthase